MMFLVTPVAGSTQGTMKIYLINQDMFVKTKRTVFIFTYLQCAHNLYLLLALHVRDTIKVVTFTFKHLALCMYPVTFI